MNIEIRNCNNIDSASITVIENKLNIKFAPNGSGKSTIAKALQLSVEGDSAQLNDLLPFKLRKENPGNKKSEINGTDSLNSIMCFNEDYVNQFVFTPDELLKNSFDILIRTDAYKQLEQEIEDLIRKIKQRFSEDGELENLTANLKEMGSAFKLTQSGLSKSSTGMKGLSAGNKIQHIPKGLEAYAPFIKCQNSVGWIDWQTRGHSFSELSDNCPYCTSHAADKREQIQKVGEEYDKNKIKNLIAIISVIEKLGDYFSTDARNRLDTIKNLNEGLGEEHQNYLRSVILQIDDLTKKLESLKTLSAFQFKEDEKVTDKLPDCKLDLQFFSELESEKMKNAIDPINESIEELINQAGLLQGKINQQRSELRKTVERHQKDINDFLANAGYRYKVEIVGEGEQSRLRLRHIDHEEHLSGGNQHLSFGERNAFAIVLFMYECLAKKPALIILDDPVSSFDRNKKYAILETLFRKKSDTCLLNKTVLMLTHDEEPIIDTTKSLKREFGNHTTASFLKLEGGIIQELNISKDDIQTFSQICTNVLSSAKDAIIKLIYLRRSLEITDPMGDAYQVLSNILHKRERPTDSREPVDAIGGYPEMDSAKFNNGCEEIKRSISDFSYDDYLSRVKDSSTLKALYQSSSNGYEKLQIIRLLGLAAENSVIQKFINETYHIENEFVCQLDPTKFDTVPEYVVIECNRMLQEA